MVRTTWATSLSIPFMALFLLTATGASEPATEELIEQLGSKKYTERERAKQLLQARGPAVLPALRKALASAGADLERRRRLEQLIPPLEAAEALTPKLVTLKPGKRSLGEVLKDVEKQTGFKV